MHSRATSRRSFRCSRRARARALNRNINRSPLRHRLTINVVSANSIIVVHRGVVVSRLASTPRLLDRGQNTKSVGALSIGVWDRPGWVEEVVGHRAGVGGVEVETRSVNDDVLVTGDVGDGLEDVGAAVPASEGGEVPVGGDGGDGREVVVESVIRGSVEGLGDSAAEEEGEDFVGGGVGVYLVEGEDDEGVVHEVLVCEEGGEEGLGPRGGFDDCCIMAVVGHVGGDE